MTKSNNRSPRKAPLLTSTLLTFGFLGAPALTQRAFAQQPRTVAEVARQFAFPPDDARPMVRWWWFGVAVEKQEILRELQQMKADGIGGAELAFVYPVVLDDPSRGLRNLPFLSPAMLDALHYAQEEGHKLGLRIDLTLGSGWPYGGPAISLAESAGSLRMVTLPIPGDATAMPVPKLEEGDRVISTFVASGTPERWSAPSARQIAPTTQPEQSNSSRVALFFISSHTRQQVKHAAIQAGGYVLDPFNRQAVATHLRTVGEPLISAFGSTPPYAIFSDSLEAYGADWTPNLPREFEKRRGYDLIAHLPELATGGTPAAEKIRHDYGRTLTELINESYLVQINDWAHAHHTKFRSQTYGEPAVSFSSEGLVDLAEGEGRQWRAFSTLRWAASANHVFGKTITSGESFTWLRPPVFRATPLNMKAEADIDFISGENQFIYHGWPYSSPQVAEPGWSLYAPAVLNHHNPWHPVVSYFNSYITRLSFLLRQGESANQVAVLLPTDDAWASVSPGKVTITGAMLTRFIPAPLVASILSAGYNLDFIDADAINRLGINHSVLVLPPTDRIPLETLRKIDAYVHSGGKVVAVGHAPSMDSDGAASPEWTHLSSELFGNGNLVSDTEHLGGALHQAQHPDLDLLAPAGDTVHDVIGFIRRRLSDSDIYFVVNTSDQPVQTHARFGTKFETGILWDPETGVTNGPSVQANDAIVRLAPYGSVLYVFSNLDARPAAPEAPLKELADLSHDWKVTFTSIGKSQNESNLTDWTSDPATIHYSGEAVYSRDVKLSIPSDESVYLQLDGDAPSSFPAHAPLVLDDLHNPTISHRGARTDFDPPVHEAALVIVNGQAAGALWHPPYLLDISKLLQTGDNHIDIHVYNTALNAWAARPPSDYKVVIERYGKGVQMPDLNQVKPISSGLLGSIRLVTRSGN